MTKFMNKISLISREPWRLSLYVRKLFCLLIIKRFVRCWGPSSIIEAPLMCSYGHMAVGANVSIGKHARIQAIKEWLGSTYEPEIIIGDDVSIEQRLHLIAASKLMIGNNSTISFDVMITDVDHQYEMIDVDISKQPLNVSQTEIGEYCFIGSGAKILAGTVLGKQCIVGANSVVRGHFPPYSVIAGTPAKIVKKYDFHSLQWTKVDGGK